MHLKMVFMSQSVIDDLVLEGVFESTEKGLFYGKHQIIISEESSDSDDEYVSGLYLSGKDSFEFSEGDLDEYEK
jgi:hypothetical protein